MDITSEKHQMTLIRSMKHDIINIYRSNGSSSSKFIADLISVFDHKQETYIVGDFNICYNSEGNHKVIKAIEVLGFKQKIKGPTHIEGRQIDHVFVFMPNSVVDPGVQVSQQSPYFTDHDILFIKQVGEINESV